MGGCIQPSMVSLSCSSVSFNRPHPTAYVTKHPTKAQPQPIALVDEFRLPHVRRQRRQLLVGGQTPTPWSRPQRALLKQAVGCGVLGWVAVGEGTAATTDAGKTSQ